MNIENIKINKQLIRPSLQGLQQLIGEKEPRRSNKLLNDIIFETINYF